MTIALTSLANDTTVEKHEPYTDFVDFATLSDSPMFRSKGFYKPFQYPWAYKYYEEQSLAHWTPKSLVLDTDVNDWNSKLSTGEKELLTSLFRFFVQGDLNLSAAYIGRYLKIFKAEELRMMMATFAATEVVHVDAYSQLLETIGMKDKEYKAFYDYKEMKAKHDYIQELPLKTLDDLALNIAVYSMFTEGMQLYSSFLILLNFPRNGTLIGSGQAIAWSVRDEDMHARGMTKVFRQLIKEHPELLTDQLKARIYAAAEKMVELEDDFIDLMFDAAKDDIKQLTREGVKDFIRYVCNTRLADAGLKKIFTKNYKNNQSWFNDMISGKEASNFFETRPSAYASGSLDTSDWKRVWA